MQIPARATCWTSGLEEPPVHLPSVLGGVMASLFSSCWVCRGCRSVPLARTDHPVRYVLSDVSAFYPFVFTYQPETWLLLATFPTLLRFLLFPTCLLHNPRVLFIAGKVFPDTDMHPAK